MPLIVSKTGGGPVWSTVAGLNAAAERGDPKACAQLGEMLLRGVDMKPDVPRALVLLEKAARAGEASAAFRLGMLLFNGDSVAEDRARGVAYLRAAAVGGNDEAFRNVGVAYSTGRGVKRDYTEALGWLILAEKHDTAGTVADDLRAYLKKIRRTELIPAGERRAPEIERELAQTTVAKALPPPAPLAHVQTAPVKLAAVSASPSSAGSAVATAEEPAGEPAVKLIAPTGRFLSWPNLAALQRAADQSSTDGLAALGQVLLDGKLLPEDTLRAVALLERAAQAGSADAASHLGDLYTKGTRIDRDDAKGFTYTLQAARGGARTAMHNLAALYSGGRGTKTNHPEALVWLIVARHFNIDSGQAARAADRIREIERLRE
ncbi:MAG: hypothetical protein NTV51_32755 [Verrucomicrobia bacterium]|nr:hypothetical protein [Verrucomicrobiota bacterium]